MAWLFALVYCGLIWLVFAKLKLMRLTLPIAVLAASVGPLLIVTLLLCAQYCHPYSTSAKVYQEVVPIAPQLNQPGRVIEIAVKANQPIKKGELLFMVDPVPYQNAITLLTATLNEAQQSQRVAEAGIDLADASKARTKANLEFATRARDRSQPLLESNAISQEDFDNVMNRFVEADAALRQADASQSQSRFAVELAKAKIAQVESQLADAEYDLAQTRVTAPEDGYVTNLQLREGSLVGGPSSATVMSFIREKSEETRGVVVAAFEQKNYLLIKPGQYAEVILNNYPGQILKGRVLNTIDVSGAGQLAISGNVPVDQGPTPPTRFAVRIRLDKWQELRLPGGSQGQAVVYTKNVVISALPVMFILRMQSWLQYLL
jgi:multidrug resistance efflux pump